MTIRRLPVYIVADCSDSMRGAPIESVKQCINSIIDTLYDNPTACETAHLSLITFADNANQVVPLTSIYDFELPELSAGGTTAFGESLSLLTESISKEVQLIWNDKRRADWRPYIFLLIDREPNDDWESQLQELKQTKLGGLFTICCGEDANLETLRETTDGVIHMINTTQFIEEPEMKHWSDYAL